MDAGASPAFAVADHQVAHVYLNDASRLPEVRALLAATPGVAEVLDDEGKKRHGLDHPRAGDLVAIAEPDAWFTYYYWLDDRAPRISPGLWISTASRGTIRSSSSSTQKSACAR